MSSTGCEFHCVKCGKMLSFQNAYGNINRPLCRECNDKKKIFKSKDTIQEEIDKEKEELGLNYMDL